MASKSIIWDAWRVVQPAAMAGSYRVLLVPERGRFDIWRSPKSIKSLGLWLNQAVQIGYNCKVLKASKLVTYLGGNVTFEVGDKVIYPNHGLGVVERIETRTIMDTTCGFYSLRMADSDTIVLVPVDNVDGVGLRRAIGETEVKKLFTLLGNGKIDNHQNWKGRFKENSDKMRTGSIYDVVDVLKNLTFLSKSKNLSFREKRMLDRAKFLVVSEISEVIGDTAEAIDLKTDKALERCFVNREKAIAKAKLATAKVKPLKAEASAAATA